MASLTPAQLAVQRLQKAQKQAQQQAQVGRFEPTPVPSPAMTIPDGSLNLNASNNTQLFSQGLSSAINSLTAPARRARQQKNLDAANLIKRNQLDYKRQQDAIVNNRNAASDRQAQANFEAQEARLRGSAKQPTPFTTVKGNDGSIRSFDAATGQYGTPIDAAKPSYSTVKNADGTTSVLDGNTGTPTGTIIGEAKPDFQTVKGDDGTVRVFDGTSGQFTGAQVDMNKPDQRYAPVKDADGRVLGSFDKTTGNTDKYGGLGLGDTISARTGYPSKWSSKQVDVAHNAATQYDTARTTMNAINNITPDDIENAAGFSSYGGAWFPSTRSSVGKFNQLLGKEFLGNVGFLKGLGALSNAEGSKITASANILVDDTNTLRTGLSEEVVKDELARIKSSYQKMMYISEFAESHGREPTIKELDGLTPVIGSDGKPFMHGGRSVRESDIKTTMTKRNMTRDAVIKQLGGQ